MTRPPDLLEAILAATRTRVKVRREMVPEQALEVRAAAQPPSRGFRRALAADGIRVIAECKRRSPSRGVLRTAYDPTAIALAYERAGAAAISVLTEPTFFDGELSHLEAVRAAVSLPLLRKDFIVSTYQVLEAKASGADAILLIVAALNDTDLAALRVAAEAAGLDALVEVHDEDELGRACDAGATIVGVNNRNLRTLDVDVDAAARLASRLPKGITAVAESGLRTHDDIDRLRALGYHAFLVGERLMSASDPGAALSALIGKGVSA